MGGRPERPDHDRSRSPQLLPRTARPVQDSVVHRVPERTAEDHGRKGVAPRAEGGLVMRPLVVVVIGLMSASLAGQSLRPGYVDPEPVLRAAEKAIGTANLKCVTIAGNGYAGMVGQQFLAEKNVDWPRGEPLADYTRTMNWGAGTMKEEFTRKPGINPAG